MVILTTVALIFSLSLALAFMNIAEAFSPKGGKHPLFKIALEAINEKNCMGDYEGEVSMQHKTVSSCFAGGFVEEVTAYPCREGACENRDARARVIFKCDNTKPRVKCL